MYKFIDFSPYYICTCTRILVDYRVSALCVEWETALLHGFKKQKGARRLGKSESPPSLWPLAKLCLSSDEVQRFIQLGRVTTDIGRGRAWFRSAINERTLENYLHTIFADESQLRWIDCTCTRSVLGHSCLYLAMFVCHWYRVFS